MKTILFDLTSTQPLGGSKRHGGGKYGEIVISRMVERALPIVCYYDGNKWLNPDIQKILSDVPLIDINKLNLIDIVKQYNCNLIYSPLPNTNILYGFQGCKIVGTIHGLRRLETPADPYIFRYKNQNWKDWAVFFYKYLFPQSFKKMLRKYYLKEWKNPNFSFITVSHHTANSIKSYFPEFSNYNIPVFYSPSTSSDKQLTNYFSEKYFMLVSGNRVEKNNLRAIIAIDRLFSAGYLKDFKVKITGVKDVKKTYRYIIKNHERFEFLGYVDEDLLEQLYHDAYALVYPSLNEGFGYPPLEAMHYGVPVLCSPFASITEVCEGAVMYFNPFSIEEISARILRISNPQVYSEYKQRSVAQYNKITEIQKNDLDTLIDYLYKEMLNNI